MTSTAGQAANIPAQVVDRLITLGIRGAGPIEGAVKVADDHLRASSDVEVAIDRLITTHVRLATVTGFVTGIGGAVALPIAVPSAVLGFYVIATRMVAGIAHLRGHHIETELVRSVVCSAC